MTDEIVRALQHHARKDEPKSVEIRLKILEHQHRITSDMFLNAGKLITDLETKCVELSNRIERLEGEVTRHKSQAYTLARDDEGFLVITQPESMTIDASGCICPTDATTDCPVCDEEESCQKPTS